MLNQTTRPQAMARFRAGICLLLLFCIGAFWPATAFSATPTASIAVDKSTLVIGQTAEVTITFSEVVTGFTLADITTQNGTVSGLATSDNITYTTTLSPALGITYAANVITVNMAGVTDAANNPGQGAVSSNNYAVDTQRPTVSIAVAPSSLTAGDTATVTFTFSEAVTGFTTADLTIANGRLPVVSSSDGGITWTATFTPDSNVYDATNLITLDNTGVSDLVGNAGTGTTDSNNYTINTVRPTAVLLITPTALKIGDTPALVTITFSEAVTDFTNADLSISNGTLTTVSSSDGGITWEARFTPSANVTYAVNQIVLDNAGVRNAAGNAGIGTSGSNNYSIDTQRPTATVVVANTSISEGQTSDVTITFSEAVTGFTLGDLDTFNGILSNLSTSDNVIWRATLSPFPGISAANNVILLDMTGVTDLYGNMGSGTVNSNMYAVNAPAMSLSPLPDMVLGLAYSQTVSVTGGTAPYTLTAGGTLPTGLTFAGGVISGIPTQPGTFSFTISATDSDGFSVARTYTKTVSSAPTAVSRRISVEAGKQAVVDLADGATGGPFTLANVASVSPAVAGTTSLAGTVLTFNAAISFDGTATVVFTLANAYATSAPVSIYFDVTGRPDPASDAEVTGLLSAQAESAKRFADSQIGNFNSRLEQLHNEGDRRRNSMAVRLGYTGNDTKGDEDRPFADLLGKASGTEAGSGFAMHNYASEAKGGSQPAKPPVDVDLDRLAVWTGGYVNFGKRDDGKLSLDYTTAGVSGGMDYRFSKSFVAGFGIGYGRDATDIGSNGSENRAHAYSGSVYASYSPAKSVYLDGLLGGSWLDLSSKRYETSSGSFANGDRGGGQVFGSITAAYEKRDDAWLISPYGRLDFARTWLGSFTETGSGAFLLKYGSQTVDTMSGVAGLRLEYALATEWGMLKPGARVEYVHDFEGSSQVSMGYADTAGLPFAYRTDSKGSDYVTLGASLDAALNDNWNARFDYRTAVGGVGRSHAFGLKAGRNF